jgi:uncharacterized protein YegL
MRNDLTEIIMIVDRSGSMEPLRADAIGGFNAFLDDQKKQPGAANLTLVLFNHGYDVVVDGRPIQEVQSLTEKNYVPSGNTALLDAIGRTINQVGKRLADMQEADRPGKVILVILTDGQENASQEFNKDQIASMVKHQQEVYKWQVVFLSSDMNAIQDAQNLGVNQQTCGAYAAGSVGTRRAYATMSKSVSNYRSTGSVGDVDSASDKNKN